LIALPRLEHPRIARPAGRLDARAASSCDAIVIVVPADAGDAAFAGVPERARWLALHARDPATAGTVRATALANAQQTTAVIAYLRRGAGAFERLALAGRAIREAGARSPEKIALVVPPATESREAVAEALLAAALVQAFPLAVFRRSAPKSRTLRDVVLYGAGRLDVPRAAASARANNLARWLTALPPSELDAENYRRLLGTLAHRHGLAMRWLDEDALRRLGANAFLAVAAGNAKRVAGIAHLRWRPAGRRTRPDVALVGKGILFDTGGTNLKPHRSMLDMHTDMAGSAVAVATLAALAELRAPIAADAWLAITENRIGPTAYRPQDVVRAANGVTIQVIHTDAEGRMALADTLVLAAREKPRLIVDFATLTGACVHALTERMSGVFTNRAALAPLLVAAGATSGERVWHFPADPDFDTDLESKVADVLQCAVEGKGDHILATRFLGRFVPDEQPWVHVDLSSATRSGGLAHVPTDVTGFGARFALELLLDGRALATLQAERR